MDSAALSSLQEQARAAAAHAYTPASGYGVGAALMAADGRVFSGCNVENASFGLTVCAERVALFSAVAAGVQRFAALAVYTPGAEPGYPCGACRQTLAEFAPDLPIVLLGDEAAPLLTSLDRLLPHPFRFDYSS